MTAAVPTIQSARLDLVLMSAEVLELFLGGDVAQASRLLQLTVPPDWLRKRWLMDLRLQQMRQSPHVEPWLLRAIGLRAEGVMIGHIGFHDAPGSEHLRAIAPGGVELGYTIDPPYRRQGYATEACAAMMDWAQETHGVRQFVLSISPENEPSLRIARHFGFRKVGSQIDEHDGPEDIFLREVGAVI